MYGNVDNLTKNDLHHTHLTNYLQLVKSGLLTIIKQRATHKNYHIKHHY